MFVALAGLRVTAEGGRAGQSPRLPAGGAARAEARAVLDRYCLTCHNTQQRQRGAVPRAFDALSFDDVGAQAGEWEAIVRRVRAGVMPPAGMPRPEPPARDAFVSFLEGELDRAAQRRPNPGRTEAFHRLNRTEYRNAVRDLLGVDVDVTALLPPDDASYGFDNIAGVLKLSPTLVERYLVAAQKISRLAVGTPPPAPVVDYFRVADDRSQEDRLPGEAIGTRGGTTVRYVFPMDAQYGFRVELSRDLNEQVPLYQEAHQLELSIDGERIHVFTLPGVGGPAPEPAQEPGSEPAPDDAPAAARPRARTAIAAAPRLNRQGQEQRNRIDRDWEVRVPVTAGPHDVQVAFIKNGSALTETARLPFLRPYPASVNVAEQRAGAYLRSVEISGPFEPSGPGNALSRQRVFTCRPSAATIAAERGCATAILRRLTRRAFRRPVSADDFAPMLAAYDAGRSEGTFDHAVEQGVMRLLVAPEFLFRIESDPASIRPGAVYRVSDLELASRLSFFLWSSIPDEELLGVAERGQLRDPAVLDAQVRRMLSDARFAAFIEGFAGQWLFLRNLSAVVPVQQSFPDFDDTLRQAFRRETELFFESIVREDRSALDLLPRRLHLRQRASRAPLRHRQRQGDAIPARDVGRRQPARPDCSGRAASSPSRRIPTAPRRWSGANGCWRTCSARRRRRRRRTCRALPKPPLPRRDVLSMRERMAQHRANPVCASCHRDDGSDRAGAREFRCRRPVAHAGRVGCAHRRVGRAARWHASTGRPACAKRCSRRTCSSGPDREAADLRARPWPGAYDAPAVRAIVRDAAPQDYRFCR